MSAGLLGKNILKEIGRDKGWGMGGGTEEGVVGKTSDVCASRRKQRERAGDGSSH